MREEIRSEKIILRRYRNDFAPLLYEAALESRGGDFSHWMPWCHENYALAESESFIARCLESWDKETVFSFAIFDRFDNGFLGGVGLNQFNSQHNFANLGYWIRTSRQNRGAASEATQVLAQASFEDLSINRIEILAAAENEPSQKAALKAGARREGILRNRLLIGGRIHDGVMFSFVREDFNL
jgi:RimJ/RimL family protein N-acetyltransferase